jgi:hypothetical protein
VASDGQANSETPLSLSLVRIAEAFEVSDSEVLADAVLVSGWSDSERALLDQLRRRHGWDGSVAPYYLLWLRGGAGGGDPPA